MTDSENTSGPKAAPPPWRRRPVSPGGLAAGSLALVLIAGAALGAGGMRLAQNWRPRSVMLLEPTAINALQPGSPSAVLRRVSEIFGNMFTVDDGSGRALIDLGPRGQNAGAVIRGETVAVQGMFDRGIVHAQIVSHADGRTEAFGPPPPPRREPPPRMAEAPPPPPPGPPPPPRRADGPPPPRPGMPPPPARADAPPPPPSPRADAPPLPPEPDAPPSPATPRTP